MKESMERGFTLIEVLVAMIIFAVGLLGLEALGVTAARAVALADHRSEYLAVATDSLESALRQLRAGQAPAPFCVELQRGELLTRSLNYTIARAPEVTVQVLPNPAGGVTLPSPLVLHSTVYLGTDMSGAQTSVC